MSNFCPRVQDEFCRADLQPFVIGQNKFIDIAVNKPRSVAIVTNL